MMRSLASGFLGLALAMASASSAMDGFSYALFVPRQSRPATSIGKGTRRTQRAAAKRRNKARNRRAQR